MRAFISVSRILVGLLFIVSGAVKANDPLGLSYKMQEFFEVWSSDLAASSLGAKALLISLFNWLHGYSLPLSIIMITLEIVAGVALLLGWRIKATLRLLLVLILFFTFLTGYALWSGKFKNCGCFGDCLPITPLSSFVKDIALLTLILLLWAGRKYIAPVAASSKALLALLATGLITLGVQWYVLRYLPFADCLPYKQGNNISQQMQMPPGAKPDSFAIRFVYKRDGKNFEFPAEALPADLDRYTYVSRVDKLIRKGNAEPPIKGFALTGVSGADSTTAILSLPKAALVLAENMDGAESWLPQLKLLVRNARASGTPVYLATAGPLQGAQKLLAANNIPEVPVFTLDFTAIRTAARTKPAIMLLQQGTIKGKYSYRQIAKAVENL